MDTMLEMNFRTGMGRRFRLTLSNPRTDLTPSEVEDAMNLIIEKDLFAAEGGVTEVDTAQIVTTQVETIVVG